MLKKIIFLILVSFFLQSCEDKFSTIYKAQITVNNNRPNTADTVLYDSINHFKFSRLNKIDVSGITSTFVLPKEHQNKALWVIFSGRARTDYAHSNSSITTAAMSEKNECLVWRAVFLRYFYTDINKWCYFKDSIYLRPDFDGKVYNEISSFAFSGSSSNEKFDIDTLNIQIKAKI